MLGFHGHLPPIGQAELNVGSPRQAVTDDPHRHQDRQPGPRRALRGRRRCSRWSQSLKPTKAQLADLTLVLLLIGGSGVVVAALAGTAVARTRPASGANG